MIQLSKNYSLPERAAEFIPIKIISVGGAGLNALDRIVLDGLERAEVVAINTDVQSLASSVAAHKVQLGRSVTRGLGAGGDPELGYQAAVESAVPVSAAAPAQAPRRLSRNWLAKPALWSSHLPRCRSHSRANAATRRRARRSLG